MNYAVPAICQRAGLLGTFYTDLYLSHIQRRFLRSFVHQGRSASLLSGAASRWSDEVPVSKTRDFKGLALRYLVSRLRAKNATENVAAHLAFSEEFGKRASRHVEPGAHNFTFNSTSLEIAAAAKLCGGVTVMEQCIAPRGSEIRAYEAARSRYPSYYGEVPSTSAWRQYARREREEARLVDWIVAPSEYVANILYRDGVEQEKIVVIPYGVSGECCSVDTYDWPEKAFEGRLTLLFVGEFGPRKGAGVAIELARHFGRHVELRVAGQVLLSDTQRLRIPDNVVLMGSLKRSSLCTEYRRADALLLPSLCEGSPTVSYEAFIHGLPVICSTEAGVSMDAGRHGVLFDFLDFEAARQAVEHVLQRREVLRTFQSAIVQDRYRWTFERYSKDLVSFLGNLETSEAVN